MDLEAQIVLQSELECRRHLLLLFTLLITHIVYYYHLLFTSSTEKIPYHTSILTGEEWTLELLNGHPDQIKTSLGIDHNVFDALVQVLIENGFKRSHYGISVEQQLAIFLYTCVTGLSTRHVGERFQHVPDTITRSETFIY